MNRLTTDLLQAHLARLYGRINYERQSRVTPREFKLHNMHRLLERLGNPHHQYQVIHVAGTKGKGSVTTLAAAILSSCNIRTGAYTSPHLEVINQRMAVDGQLISDEQLLKVLDSIMPVISEMDTELESAGMRALTFFEVTTAAALYFFAQMKCQVVALEVGLGGRLDSTNACRPSVCVITNIGFDHTKILGDTLSLIAGEKAGIIKPSIPVVSGVRAPEAVEVIRAVAKKNDAPLFELDHEYEFSINVDSNADVSDPFQPKTFDTAGRLNLAGTKIEYELSQLQPQLLGDHMAQNASIAIAAVKTLAATTDLKVDEAGIARGVANAKLAGRTEVVSRKPIVILDIAHNVVSIKALIKTLCDLPAWRSAARRRLLFAVSRDKDASGMLDLLIPNFDEITLTKFQNNPRGMEIADLQSLVEQSIGRTKSDCKVNTKADPVLAWDWMKQKSDDDDLIAVIGSVFLVSEVRPLIV